MASKQAPQFPDTHRLSRIQMQQQVAIGANDDEIGQSCDGRRIACGELLAMVYLKYTFATPAENLRKIPAAHGAHTMSGIERLVPQTATACCSRREKLGLESFDV